MSSCFSRALFASAPDFTFTFSLRRGLFLKRVFSRASFRCTRLVLVGLLILSSLCSHLFSVSVLLCWFRCLFITHQPAPLSSCPCSSRSFFWLGFSFTLPLDFAFSSSRTKPHGDGICNRSFLVDPTWTLTPVPFACTGCPVSCFLIQPSRPFILDNPTGSKQLHYNFLLGYAAL